MKNNKIDPEIYIRVMCGNATPEETALVRRYRQPEEVPFSKELPPEEPPPQEPSFHDHDIDLKPDTSSDYAFHSHDALVLEYSQGSGTQPAKSDDSGKAGVKLALTSNPSLQSKVVKFKNSSFAETYFIIMILCMLVGAIAAILSTASVRLPLVLILILSVPLVVWMVCKHLYSNS